MYTLLKVLRNEKTPALRNYLTLPLQLNAEPDDALLRLTENRVPAFSHDFVPNLLRTKPDPELEMRYHQLQSKMNIVNADTSSVSDLGRSVGFSSSLPSVAFSHGCLHVGVDIV